MINFEERIRQMQEEALKCVEANGFHIHCVINCFVYTSGLASKGLPDIIASVPPSQGLVDLVGEAAEMLIAGKEGMFDRYESEYMALKNGSPLYLKLVEVPWSNLMRNEYVAQADALYDRYPHLEVKPRRLVQLLVPDSNGVLPDDPNYRWPKINQELYYQFGKVIHLASERHCHDDN